LSTGKVIRLSDFIDPGDGRGLILELDYGSMIGFFERKYGLDKVLEKASRFLDGVILNRGLARQLKRFFMGRRAPALLLRADWTNVWRGPEHPLPAVRKRYRDLTSALDAVRYGASGVVTYLIMGQESDEDEAANIEAVARLARECDEYGLPLLVEALPIGERVLRENYLDALGLAMRIAVEAGASCVAIPYPGDLEGLKFLVKSCNVPLMLMELDGKIARWQPSYRVEDIAEEALKAGISGFVVGRGFLERPGFEERLNSLRRMVHSGGGEG